MDFIVAIIEGSRLLFWQALARALEQEAGVRVIVGSSVACVETILGEHRPELLVFESDGDATGYEQYLESHPGLVLVGIDPDGADLLVRFRDIALRRFVDLIRNIAQPADPAADFPDTPRLKLVSPREVESLLASSSSADSSDLPPSTASRSVPPTRTQAAWLELECARRWIEVCLHQRLECEVEVEAQISAPAWAMTAARARGLLRSEFSTSSPEERRRAREELERTLFTSSGPESRFLDLCEDFALTFDERRLLLMALAPEIDGVYARVCGFLNDDLTRRRPSTSLLAELLFDEGCIAWDLLGAFGKHTALGHHGLLMVDPDDTLPTSEAGVIPAPEIVSFLLAPRDRPPVYAPFIAVAPAAVSLPDETSSVELRRGLGAWREAVARESEEAPLAQLVGDDATRVWFERVATESGDAVVTLDLGVLGPQLDSGSLRDRCLSAARVAVLTSAILVLTGRESLPASQQGLFDSILVPELRRRTNRVVVHGNRTWLMRTPHSTWMIEVPRPTASVRAAIWQERARALGITISQEVARSLGATVRFGEAEIDAALRSCPEVEPRREQLLAAARRVARSDLPSSVRRVEPGFDWNDIVLPAEQHVQLQQIPAQVQYAGRVLDDWGYRQRLPYGDGVAALFCGPSGTGKTMAAQIIANELGVELFQVDLAKTVSKYIGETERNLDGVFDASEKASAVLLFDEADALFGKRTEVRDAHDRYANIEVSYLLQRMESYSGLAILTTNMRQNLDRAFLRRLRFVVEFPLPSARDREEIWKRVFPPGAPLAEDVAFAFLARRLDLSGGHIQQIAIRSAFLAIAHGEAIEMKYIVEAAREELRKLGMTSAEETLAALAA